MTIRLEGPIMDISESSDVSITSDGVDTLINLYVDPSGSEESHSQAFSAISSVIDSRNGAHEGTLSIQDLVGRMEQQLTSSDDKARHRATMLLADLLHLPALQTSYLEPAVVHLFVVFFCHRLSDYPSIVPSLHALLALVKYHPKSFNPKYCDILDICQTVFREIHVEALAQTIRQKVFELFLAIFSSECIQNSDSISEGKSSSIEIFGSEKVCMEIFTGLVNSMEGEKDPRCLVAALNMLKQGMTHFSFLFTESSTNSDDVIEKLFDNVACYFPITFIPPEDDPFGVTAESLLLSLENVLCAHAALHKHVLPFLVDHLTDEHSLGRVQATNLLSRLGTSEEYSPKVFRYIAPEDTEAGGKDHSVLAAMAERFFASATENPPGDAHDPLTVNATLKAIESICREIGTDMGPNGMFLEDWRMFGEVLLRKCVDLMASNISQQHRAAVCVALSIARSCVLTCRIVTDRLMPSLLGKCSESCGAFKGSILKSYLAANTQYPASKMESMNISSSNTTSSVSLITMKSLICCLDGSTSLPLDSSQPDNFEYLPQVDYSGLGTTHPLYSHSRVLFEMLAGALWPLDREHALEILRGRERGSEAELDMSNRNTEEASIKSIVKNENENKNKNENHGENKSEKESESENKGENEDVKVTLPIYPDALTLDRSLTLDQIAESTSKLPDAKTGPNPGVKIGQDVLIGLSEVVNCLRVMLLRIDPNALDFSSLSRLVRTLTDISIRGISCLWLPALPLSSTSTSTSLDHSAHKISEGNDRKIKCILKESTVALLSALARTSKYENVMRTDCVSVLVTYVTHESNAGYMSNAFATLASLLKQSPKGGLLSHCLPFLISATQVKSKTNDQTVKNETIKNGESVVTMNQNDVYTQRRMSAIAAISDLFLTENEILTADNDGKIKIIGGCSNENGGNLKSHDTSAHAHVHTSSCTHDHDVHAQERANADGQLHMVNSISRALMMIEIPESDPSSSHSKEEVSEEHSSEDRIEECSADESPLMVLIKTTDLGSSIESSTYCDSVCVLVRRVMKTLFVNFQYEVEKEKEKEKKGNGDEEKNKNNVGGGVDRAVEKVEKEVVLSAVKRAENLIRCTAIEAVRYILLKSRNESGNENTINRSCGNENRNKDSTKSSLQLICSFLCYLPHKVVSEIFTSFSGRIPTNLGLLCVDFKTDFDVINGCIIFALNNSSTDFITNVEVEVEVEVRVGNSSTVKEEVENEVENGLLSDAAESSAMLLALVLNKLPSGPVLDLVLSNIILNLKKSILNYLKSYVHKSQQDDTQLKKESTTNILANIKNAATLFMWAFKSIITRPDIKNALSTFSWPETFKKVLLTLLTSPVKNALINYEIFEQLEDSLFDGTLDSDSRIAEMIAERMIIITTEHSYILPNKSNNGTYFNNFSPFWKQKSWAVLGSILLSKISNLNKNNNSNSNSNSNSNNDKISMVVNDGIIGNENNDKKMEYDSKSDSRTRVTTITTTTESEERTFSSACLLGLLSLTKNMPGNVLRPYSADLSRVVIDAFKIYTEQIASTTTPPLSLPLPLPLPSALSLSSSLSTTLPSRIPESDPRSTSLSTSTADTLKLHCLETLENLLEESPTDFLPHTTVIIPLFLKVSQHDSNPMSRTIALKCLLKIRYFPYTKIHPFKNLVVRGVGKVTDDNKRAVRLFAAKVRNEWMVIGLKD